MGRFLDELGLDDLGLEDPNRAVELTAWRRPPAVEVVGGRLVASGEPDTWRAVGRNQAGLLVEFGGLAEADDEQVRRFAATWGLLGLCGHNRPQTHTSGASVEVGVIAAPTCTEPLEAQGEPIETWRAYAAQASAFLQIHRRLLDGNKTTATMWDPLRPLYPAFLNLPDDRPPGQLVQPEDLGGRTGRIGEIRLSVPALRDARPALAYAVRRWLEMGAVGVQFEWTGSIGTIRFGGASLFGALATLVAVTLSGADGPILCSHCRLPYTPNRKPRGPQHFCQDCRNDHQPQKYARRAYNARQRAT